MHAQENRSDRLLKKVVEPPPFKRGVKSKFRCPAKHGELRLKHRCNNHGRTAQQDDCWSVYGTLGASLRMDGDDLHADVADVDVMAAEVDVQAPKAG